MASKLQVIKRSWKEFQRHEPRIANEITNVVLQICEEMTGVDQSEQIEVMRESAYFSQLKLLIEPYAPRLGVLVDSADEMFAVWLRTICFLTIAEAEIGAIR